MTGKNVVSGLAEWMSANWGPALEKLRIHAKSLESSATSAAPSASPPPSSALNSRIDQAVSKAAGLTPSAAEPTAPSSTMSPRSYTPITIQILRAGSITHTISCDCTALEDSTALTAIYRLLTRLVPGKWPALQQDFPNLPKPTSPPSDFKIAPPNTWTFAKQDMCPSCEQPRINIPRLGYYHVCLPKSLPARLSPPTSKTRVASKSASATGSSQSAKRSSRGKRRTGSKTTTQ